MKTILTMFLAVIMILGANQILLADAEVLTNNGGARTAPGRQPERGERRGESKEIPPDSEVKNDEPLKPASNNSFGLDDTPEDLVTLLGG